MGYDLSALTPVEGFLITAMRGSGTTAMPQSCRLRYAVCCACRSDVDIERFINGVSRANQLRGCMPVALAQCARAATLSPLVVTFAYY